MYIFKIFFILIGIGILGISLNDFLDKKDLFLNSTKVQGAVNKKILTKYERENYVLIIGYAYKNTTYTYESNSYGYEKTKIGDTVELLISENDPTLCRINSFQEMYMGFIFMLIIPLGYIFYKLWFPKDEKI